MTECDDVISWQPACWVPARLTLPGLLQLAEAGEVQSGRAQSAIFINLHGGPSHLDTFDLKPDAPAEFRGSFNPIKTNVPGISICEHLPKLAQHADKFAILRGVTHTLAAHQLGQEYVNTGNRPLPSLQYPGYGAVIAKERPSQRDLPSFVAIPNSAQRPGYLGVQYAPLNTGATPRAGQPFSVRGIAMTGGLTVDGRPAAADSCSPRWTSGSRTSSRKISCWKGWTSSASKRTRSLPRAKRARRLTSARNHRPLPSRLAKIRLAVSCLLATRLVESGVRFVTVSLGGWDTHQDNFTRLRENLLPKLDEGLAALFNGLQQKGLLESTAVLVTGEFGRTPKINSAAPKAGATIIRVACSC